VPEAPRPRVSEEFSVQVDRLAYGGEGVGRHDEFVVFVDRAAPNERALVRITRMHRRHAEADLIEVQSPSPGRIDPRCRHFSEGCGGCAWQHLNIETQLEAKAAIVRESLERVGGFRDLPLRPIVASPSPWYYRNKMEFAFHPETGLGLHPRGAWNRVFTLETCFLQSPLSVELVKTARAFVRERGLSLYDPEAHQGLLRELMIRQSHATGEVMVGIITGPGPFAEEQEMAALLAAVDPKIVSVVRGIRSREAEAAPLIGMTVLQGKGTITDHLGGLRFQIGLETFFQTNTAQAERLVEIVRDLAGDIAGGFAIDVYCGVGIFSLALASSAAQVAGIEIVPAAIEAARANAAGNGITNATFHVGDARHALPEVLALHGPPRLAILDPPRAGAGGKVMRRIARANPERIVYVSCNPTTLARDLQELVPFGYQITAVQPIDLFPQTYHVETVVALERRS
jgi:23S rRNA (uracil1939-C5)-methyltransferase